MTATARTTTAQTLFIGRTHVAAGRDGFARSSDGLVDVKLAQPHPAAEQFFAAAWSACYLGAIELAAAQKKVKLSGAPWTDTEIDLNRDGDGYFLSARFNVSIPGVDRALAAEIAETAHAICPYSKAIHGNIAVSTNIL